MPVRLRGGENSCRIRDTNDLSYLREGKNCEMRESASALRTTKRTEVHKSMGDVTPDSLLKQPRCPCHQ